MTEIVEKHGKNSIKAIKELRGKTGLGPKDAMAILDGVSIRPKNKNNKESTKNTDNKKDRKKTSNKNYLISWAMILSLICVLSILNIPSINEKYSFYVLFSSIISMIIFTIWFVFSLILRKDRQKPQVGLIISMIVILGSFISMVAGVKPILFLCGVFFIYKYNKKKNEKRLKEEKLREEEYRIARERRNNMIKHTLDLIFKDNEMNKRLKEFILQHTKRYDYNEIDDREYSNTLDMFLTYINKKVDAQFNNDIDRDLSSNIDREIIGVYIEDKKNEIYSDEMRERLKINECETLKCAVQRYLEVFGNKGLKGYNLKVFSEILDKDYEDICDLVKRQYNQIKSEYEMKQLEGHLFKSEANSRDIRYVDSLSGFEFEDFLEELFIGFGYESKELPYSNDYGADLIINKGFNEIVIQAKNYSGNVGNKAIQEVISAKVYYKSDIAMVITNSYYTQNAIKTAQASGVILIDRDGLEKILSEGGMYFNSLVS